MFAQIFFNEINKNNASMYKSTPKPLALTETPADIYELVLQCVYTLFDMDADLVLAFFYPKKKNSKTICLN